MHGEKIIKQYERIQKLEYLIGIPEEIENFHDRVLGFFKEFEKNNSVVNEEFLKSLVRRQTAFLGRINKIKELENGK